MMSEHGVLLGILITSFAAFLQTELLHHPSPYPSLKCEFPQAKDFYLSCLSMNPKHGEYCLAQKILFERMKQSPLSLLETGWL